MITLATHDEVYEFRELSTDIKPLGTNVKNANVKYDIANGSMFLEMDTANIYMLSITKNGDEYIGEWLKL